MKFNGQGGFITKFGSGGPGDGQFGSVYGLATDSAANVYVLDQHFGGTTGGSPPFQVQKFNSSGTFLTKWDDGRGLSARLPSRPIRRATST